MIQNSVSVLSSIVHHNWPGNVRESEQMVRAAAAMADGASADRGSSEQVAFGALVQATRDGKSDDQ